MLDENGDLDYANSHFSSVVPSNLADVTDVTVVLPKGNSLMRREWSLDLNGARI
jgi:hypothetical protein